MSEIGMWANYGSLVDSSGVNLGMDNQNMLDSLCWLELKSYLDSVISATGNLPHHYYHIPQKHYYEYRQLYYGDYDYKIVNGDTIYYKELYNPEIFPEYYNSSKVINTNAPRTSIKVFPSPAMSNNVTIEINSPVSTYGSIQFTNFSIADIFNVWKGVISKGENKIVIDISDLSSGSYSVIFHDKNNHQSYSGSKINIVK